MNKLHQLEVRRLLKELDYIKSDFDYKNEIGIRYLNTELWSFKTSDQQALNAKINEFAVLYQRSLNGNSDLYSNRFNFTHNLVVGLSLISFKSRTYSVNPATKVFTVFSSVGNGIEPTSLGLIKPDAQMALGGILGYNIGVRLSESFSLYLENTFNENNSLSLSYTRTTQRPGYNELRPYEQKISETLSYIGNINLNPMFINSTNLTFIAFTISGNSNAIFLVSLLSFNKSNNRSVAPFPSISVSNLY